MKAWTTATRVTVNGKEKILFLRLKVKNQTFWIFKNSGISWTLKGGENFKALKLEGLKRKLYKYFTLVYWPKQSWHVGC